MKKFLCVVMALCLMLSATAVLAEEAPALNWEDFEPIMEASGVTGEFVTFDEIAVKIWIPEGMNAVELTQEDIDKGFIGYFAPEDQSASLSVVYVNTDGMTLEEYGESLAAQEGVTEIEFGTVNGLPCVTYEIPEHRLHHRSRLCAGSDLLAAGRRERHGAVGRGDRFHPARIIVPNETGLSQSKCV